MNFDREWTQFALDAEVDHFGTVRIAKAHNALRATIAQLKARIEESDQSCIDTDGAPTEMAVLKRFLIEHHNKGK